MASKGFSLSTRASLAGAVVLSALLTVAVPASAASAGPNAATVVSSPTWVASTEATGAANGVCASAGSSASIDLTGFGFSVPAASKISGIAVEAKFGRAANGSNTQAKIQLLKTGGPIGASKDLAGSPQAACASVPQHALGSASDLWGVSSLTGADVSAARFGVRITTGTAATTWRLDAVRITLHFTPDSTAPNVTLTSPASGLTNDDTPTISGIAGTEPGDAATITVDVHPGTIAQPSLLSLITSRDGVTGAFSIEAPQLTDGMYAVRARQSDDAGNTGSSVPLAFTVDATAPSASVALAGGQTQLTNDGNIGFEVAFDEAVTGFDADDVIVSGTASTSGLSVAGAGALYEVSLVADTDGTVAIEVRQGAGSDAAGNESATSAVSDLVTFDGTAPVVTSVERTTAQRTNAQRVAFEVTFSEPVTGVDVDQFVVSTDGTLVGTSVEEVLGSDDAYTVVVDTGTGDGALGIDVVADPSIADAASNPLVGGGAGDEGYILDRTAPETAIDATLSVNEAGVVYVPAGTHLTGTSGECGATTEVTFVDLISHYPTYVQAELGDCVEGVQSWSAAPPASGPFDAFASSVDVAGNTGPSSNTVTVIAVD